MLKAKRDIGTDETIALKSSGTNRIVAITNRLHRWVEAETMHGRVETLV